LKNFAKSFSLPPPLSSANQTLPGTTHPRIHHPRIHACMHARSLLQCNNVPFIIAAHHPRVHPFSLSSMRSASSVLPRLRNRPQNLQWPPCRPRRQRRIHRYPSSRRLQQFPPCTAGDCRDARPRVSLAGTVAQHVCIFVLVLRTPSLCMCGVPIERRIHPASVTCSLLRL